MYRENIEGTALGGNQAARQGRDAAMVKLAERAVEHELGCHELVRRVNLTRRPTLELHNVILVDVTELSQHKRARLQLPLEESQVRLAHLRLELLEC